MQQVLDSRISVKMKKKPIEYTYQPICNVMDAVGSLIIRRYQFS